MIWAWAAWSIWTAGWCKFLAGIENALHGYAWTDRALARFRVLHVVAMAAIPTFMAWRLAHDSEHGEGWRRSGLLPFWAVPSSIGLFFLIRRAYRSRFTRPPTDAVLAPPRVVDAKRLLGPLATGNSGPVWMTRLPGNECFQLEINERTLPCPRLPPAWDGLSLAHFSDLHFHGPVSRDYFELVFREIAGLNADVALFTGDLVDSMDLLPWTQTTLGQLHNPLGRFFILGNHDWYQQPRLIRHMLQEQGWVSLAGAVCPLERNGSRIYLSGSERPWMGRTPQSDDLPADAFHIHLTHSPDGIVWARRHAVDLALAGHTHGGQIKLPLLGPVYSPSFFGCQYADGLFREEHRWMHVSRGVSGRDPVRYRCRPEITKIILRRSASSAAP